MAVSQPAANTWDLDEVTHAALALLRLETADVDAELVASAAQEATQLIDVELDKYPVEDTEESPAFDAGAVPTLANAAAKLAAHLYLNPSGDDPVAVVRSEVAPWRERWGLA